MKSKSTTLFILSFLLVLALFTVSVASGQQIGTDTITRRGSNTRVEWRPQIAYEKATLTVIGPDGTVYQRIFLANETPYFQTFSADGELLANGSYTYELSLTPLLSAETKATLAAVSDDLNRQAAVEELTQSGQIPDSSLTTIAGYLSIQNGKFVVDNMTEEEGQYEVDPVAGPSAIEDQVIADDLIVQGSICAGFDCVNNESFGFDTLRLKENNTRIGFQDTSVGAFPSNDWQLTANDSASGGANKFSIDDIDNAKTPFTIEANAPSNSLFVDDGGRIGFGTSTPVTTNHLVNGNTPTVRLDQNGSSGFAAQTWDIAGNEANFFIRDITNGSKLPFRIRPGAPTSSIDIAASGNVGIGTSNPSYSLHVVGSNIPRALVETNVTTDYAVLQAKASSTYGGLYVFGTAATGTSAGGISRASLVEFNVGNNSNFLINQSSGQAMILATANSERIRITSTGNVGIGTPSPTARLHVAGNIVADGTITGLSSRAMKENLVETDGNVLDRVLDLSIYYYNYKADDDSVQHVGPMSEDFAAAFGVGADDKHISPMDMAGVAIAAVQELYKSVEMTSFEMRALQVELTSQQDRIAELEAQNTDLEARLAALEALVLAQMEENSGK